MIWEALREDFLSLGAEHKFLFLSLLMIRL